MCLNTFDPVNDNIIAIPPIENPRIFGIILSGSWLHTLIPLSSTSNQAGAVIKLNAIAIHKKGDRNSADQPP